MKRACVFFLSIFATVGISAAARQLPGKDEVTLVLPQTLQNSKMEFSSMAWYKDQLWVVSQYPDRFGGEIYGIARKAVTAGVHSGKEIVGYSTWKVEHLDEVKAAIGETYEGFESTCVIGNKVYFTIESSEKNANCYLVSARIQPGHIVLDPSKIISLPKEKRLSNAGFESLAQWKETGMLLSFFEYNKEPDLAKAIVIDPEKMAVVNAVALPPLPFRITDMVYSAEKGSAGSFLGINHLYLGKKENAEYIGADSLLTDEPSLAGKNLKHTNYTRIVRLTLQKDETLTWKKVRDIDFTDANWEGIAPFEKGVLLITDEYPGSVLRWFSIPNKD